MIGYVTFTDVDTNISDRVVIRAYENIEAGTADFSEYVFNKGNLKMLSRETCDRVYLPYTVALDILNTALELDKKSMHYVDMSFVYIPHEKLDIKVDK